MRPSQYHFSSVKTSLTTQPISSSSPLGSHLVFVQHWPLFLMHCLALAVIFECLPDIPWTIFRQVLSVKFIRPFCNYHGPGAGLNMFYFICTSHSPARLILLILLSVLCRGGSEAQKGNLLRFTYVSAYMAYNTLSVYWGAWVWLEGELVFGWAGKRRKGFPISMKDGE